MVALPDFAFPLCDARLSGFWGMIWFLVLVGGMNYFVTWLFCEIAQFTLAAAISSLVVPAPRSYATTEK